MAKRPAFTIIEVLVITGLVASLLVFTSLNLLSPQRSSALESTTTTLNSDLRHQQLQAMTGTSGGGDYGIYFNADSYVLFPGAAFTPGDPANFSIALEPSLQFSSISWPNPLVFQAGSGQVTGAGTLTLSPTGGGTPRIFTINTYGTITQIQ